MFIIFQNVMEFEETEAESRSGEQDLALFKKTCAEISRLMREILELKLRSQQDTNSKKELNEKRIEASLHFVTLKKLNRLDKLRLKKARESTNSAKQRVDAFHLQLENMLYEVFHLRKEVGKCHEFKSKDEDIELVAIEEFYQEAPSNISKVVRTTCPVSILIKLLYRKGKFNLKLNWYFLIENIFVSSGDSSKESFCLGAHISTFSTWV